MYLSPKLIRQAVTGLGDIHPFFGITYLVCKRDMLPVGKMIEFPINKAEEEFLRQHYKPDLKSDYYFQPFRTSSRQGRWLSHKYPHSGSQKTRTSGELSKAFLHTRATNLWGWQNNYVKVLRSKMDIDKTERIPAFWLAVWLYRERDWPKATTGAVIVRQFLKEFRITDGEQEELFRTTVPDIAPDFLMPEPYTDDQLLRFDIGQAPDAAPEEGGTLQHLEISGIGPTHKLEFNPAERLSVITGDNGLGKTFILECAWWSLTGTWAERQAYPRMDAHDGESAITFTIAGQKNLPQRKSIQFDYNTQHWPTPKGRPIIPGLTLYARVDGSFAVFDPVRHGNEASDQRSALVFSRDQVMNGQGKRIEGLLRDWVGWQRSPDQTAFEMFKAVLKKLSPPDMKPLEPGDPVRLMDDAREIPTLRHPYDLVPFTNESAGVKRIVTVAYLLVWAWNEHKIYSNLSKKAPQNRMVILIDEMEAHLHPKWQRVVLPALLDVTSILGKELEAQVIVVTHSPLILASLEQDFQESMDKLFHLQITGNEVKFGEVQFVRHGRVDAWLTSELFELRQPTSQPTEHALERAKAVLSEENPNPANIQEIHTQLSETLPADDEFWPRWLYFVQQKGIKL
ncbi:MAG TPA: AAA family ATPase [Terriglobia bacterium]|nr:AAA family ATPase [Terriglobia bacterium]